MLPTNSGQAKDQGCSPVSSNCVVWQGPDLDCIGLCKGDTVSDVIAKMATELCTLINMFDLSKFDFTCLSVSVSERPNNTGELIQILITRICALEGIDTGSGGSTSGSSTGDCPDNCVVPIADCFYYIDPRGDTVTTMTLIDYVTAIGNKICDILQDIIALQDSVAALQEAQNTTTTALTRVEEDKADITSLNYQVNEKTSPSGTLYITDALREVENSLISTQDSLGTPSELYQNLLKQGNITNEDKMYGTGLMSNITGWTNSVTTNAESIGNLWLAVNDLREQVQYISDNCCSSGCSDIYLNFRASLVGSTITLFTDGSTGFTPSWVECTGTSVITVTDSLGNSTNITTSLIALISEPLGYTFDLAPTSVDFTTNLSVVADTCFLNTETETQCSQPYTDEIFNTPDCPAVVLTVYTTAINYQFNTTPGYTYVTNVYYTGGTTPVASQIIATPGVQVIQSISGLLADTGYEFEVVIVNTKGEETPCPKQAFTTLADICTPPDTAVAILTI